MALKLKITEHSIGFFLLTTGATLNYVFDGINKLGKIYDPAFSRSAILYRLLLELVSISVICIFFNKKRMNWLILFAYFLSCFIAGNLYLKYAIGIDVFLIEQFVYFNKYFFIFFIFFATYKTIENKDSLQRIIKNFKKIFLFNGYIAIIGLLFKIKIFSTFPIGTPRFGYDGLLLSQNEASIFYLLGMFIYYYDWKVKKKSFKHLFFILFICLLTGMKAVFLGVSLLVIFHFLSKITLKKIIYLILGLTISITTLVLSFSKLKVIFGYYYWFFTTKGFLYSILGGRNTFIKSRIIPYIEKMDIINYILGGQNISNINNYLALVEMDFVDLFLFFGVLNGFVFLYVYKTHIIGVIKSKFFYFVVSVFFLQSFFSGHFFTSSVNPIYIIIVFAYINTRINDKAVY